MQTDSRENVQRRCGIALAGHWHVYRVFNPLVRDWEREKEKRSRRSAKRGVRGVETEVNKER